MNRTSEFSRNIPTDAQSMQSSQTARTAQSGVVQGEGVTTRKHREHSQQQHQQHHQQQHQQHPQQQQQALPQVERQRIQRSSSSVSSHSTISDTGAAVGRTEGPIGTGLYPQYAAEGVTAHVGSFGSVGSSASGERRQGRFRQQVIRLPDQPSGQVRQVRHRLPTPEPDTLERVYIQRTGAEVVEEITEIPTTPPPRVQERTVVEPAGPPQVVKRTVRVPPRGGAYGGYQQQQGFHYQPPNLTGGISYGNVQQGPPVAGIYQQQPGGSFPGGYNAASFPPVATSFVANYGGVGGATGLPQAKGPVTGPISFVIDANSSQALPPLGCQPAFCFYV